MRRYWELVEFMRKFVLASALIFFNPGSNSQVLVAILVCVLFLCLVATFKPYRDVGDDRTNTMAYMCLVMTLVLGMAIKVQQYEQTGTETQDKALFTTLLIIVNLALLTFSIFQMVIDVMDSAATRVNRAKAISRAALQKKRAEEDRNQLNS